MADKLSFSLVSPERMLAEGEAEMVVIPGMQGDLGALPGHEPFLTTLRDGVVSIRDGSNATDYIVHGGFAEITPTGGVAILAEEAFPKSEVTAEHLRERIEKARADLDKLDAADHHSMASASQRLNDLIHILDHHI